MATLPFLVVAVFVLSLGAPVMEGRSTPGATPAVDTEALVILAFPPGDVPGVTAVGTLGQVIGLQPGEEVILALGTWDYEQCGVGVSCFIPAGIRAAWSVIPGDGASVDPTSGLLSIESDIPGDSRFTVTAAVEGGREPVTAEVYVYTPESNPFVGTWHEVAQLSCEDGGEIAPEQPIQELVFAADGRFAVTWVPFESYVDYWGEYRFDLARGTLDLSVTGSIQSPDDIDAHGTFAVDANGDLVLSELWLGTSQWATGGVVNCGHRFTH